MHVTYRSLLIAAGCATVVGCKFPELPAIDTDAPGADDDGSPGTDATTDAATDAGIDATPRTWSVPMTLALNTTTLAEALPSAAPSGVELFFSSPPNTSTFIPDIYFVTRATPADPWGSVRMPVVAINTSQSQSDPNISADGLELVYFHNGEIYSVRRSAVGGAWGSPATTSLTGSFPNLLADGLNMYYRPSGVSCPVATCRTRVSRASPSGVWGSPVQEQFPPGGYQAVYVSGDGLRALLSSPSTTTVSPMAISRRNSLSAAWGPAEPILELANYTAMRDARWNWDETEMYLSASQGTDNDIYLSRLQP